MDQNLADFDIHSKGTVGPPRG